LRKLAGTFDLASVYRRALGQANLLSQLNDLTPLLDCFRARRPKRAARSSPSFVRPRPRATFDPQILSAGARGWVKTGRRPRLDVIEHAGHALMVGVDSRAGRRFPFDKSADVEMTAHPKFIPAPVKNTVSREEAEKLDVSVGTIERIDDVLNS